MTAKEIRAKAFAAVTQNLSTFLTIEIIYLFLTVATVFTMTLFGLGSIFYVFIIGPLVFGSHKIAMRALRGERVTPAMLGDGFSPYGTCVRLRFFDQLFVSLWSILLVVPGILRAFSYALGTFVLADNPHMTHSEAREESIHLMEGNRWRLARLYLSFTGWLLLCVLTCGLLLFFVMPYMYTAVACFYEQVKAEKAPPVYVPLEEEQN